MSNPFRRAAIRAAALWLLVPAGSAVGQNDWQFPDPYFGAFQHRAAGTPQAERRYRAEIAPQQHRRLHDQRVVPAAPPGRWFRRTRAAGPPAQPMIDRRRER